MRDNKEIIQQFLGVTGYSDLICSDDRRELLRQPTEDVLLNDFKKSSDEKKLTFWS